MSQEIQTILTISSLIVGIIGIILAILFYMKTRNDKQVFFEIKSANLISKFLTDRIIGLEVFLNKEKISDLSMSRIVIWNAGNKTINNFDIPENGRFYLLAKNNVKIFSIKIDENTDDFNNLKLIRDESKYFIDFEYLDSKQGFTIEVIHSGKDSSNFAFGGKLKGGFRLKQYSGFVMKRKFDPFLLYLTPFLGVGVIVSVFLFDFPLLLQIFMIFCGFVFLFIGIWGISLKIMPIRYLSSLNKKQTNADILYK